ncbi:response regulator [Rhizobium sp. HT1-10]|uniref:response regulator n=1 Tax=Rhizobium sp. HT1-10 TaxID=3111638 RepID=UPI003C177E21
MAGERTTVLVVEDEALIRLDIADALEDAGFNVLEAANVDEAVTVLAAHPEIRAVFTDIDMPGSMDGLRLAAVVCARWPRTKIIVTSGRPNVTPADLPFASRFVSKPYNPATVVRNLSQMLTA